MSKVWQILDLFPRRLSWPLRAAAILAVIPIAVAFRANVDLTPAVDQSFFFASGSAAFNQAREIREVFPNRAQIVVSATHPDISSDVYLRQIEILSERLLAAPGVTAVKSISHGPGSYDDAAESPFWRTLLLGDDGRSTLIIVFADPSDNSRMIETVEDAIERHSVGDFKLRIAGPPYVVEMIKRSLIEDMRTFIAAALAIFAVLIIVIYRSPLVAVGMIVACADAVMLTLLTQSLLGQRIGVLTANLGTIVVVLTLSHTIFLTGNWRRYLADKSEDAPLAAAMARTLSASFWCMVTTGLGFFSLLLLDAQPLRELGVGGAIGTLMAIASAYLIYPAFLGSREKVPVVFPALRSRSEKTASLIETKAGAWWVKRHLLLGGGLIAACIAMAPGVHRLNTDPSLLSYFNEDGPVYEGLAHIDRNGGSSPLTLVVKLADDARLDTSEAYGRMWDMQGEMSQLPGVGTIISLPVLMAEGDRNPIGSLLPWNWLLDILSSPRFEGVARSFVTEDRSQALFVLRMKEQEREQPRVEIVEQLRDVAEKNGFAVTNTGGVYFLQGKLAELVGISLFEGLGLLLILFLFVAYAVSRSWHVSGAMLVCVALLPVALLGGIGVLHIPLDIVAAPATNVCIGMAVDAMIHLSASARRNAAGPIAWSDWSAACREQWRPTLISAVVVGTGFSIFALSEFPPSQRFGVTVAIGAVIAAALALVVLPLLASSGSQLRQAKSTLLSE